MAHRPAAFLALVLLAPFATPRGGVADRPDVVELDMARGWHRRDWRKCQDPTRVAFLDGVIAFDSPGASALVWQVPTIAGPAEIDPSLRWVGDCDRAPASFARGMLARADDGRLIALADFPYLSWRWKVDQLVDDSATAGRNGKVRREGNDFAAKLGLLVAESGRDELREMAYVWTRSLPVETVLYQETVILPLVWKLRAHRIVVETGEARLGQWVGEVRDLRADFERLFPGRRPGRVLRAYLMTDSDDTRGRAAASYAGIAFLRRRP